MRFVKSQFESCYGWEKVMEIILECLDYYYDEEDFQKDCQTIVICPETGDYKELCKEQI